VIWVALASLAIGFGAGVVLTTLAYTPMVDKVKALDQKLARDQELINDAIKTLQAYERQNAQLRADLDQMQRLMPRAIAQFYDAPYKSVHEP
jgi:hypothetical protein